MKRKILIIISILFSFYIFLEIIASKICLNRYNVSLFDYVTGKAGIDYPVKIQLFNKKTYDKNYRAPFINTAEEASQKKSVIIFGCSYAYGSGLNRDVFGELIHKLSKRNVYNRSEEGIGPQIMLYQLSETPSKLPKDCDYIIYVYASDSEERTVKYRCWPFLYKVVVRYKLMKDNSLKLQKISPLFAYSFIYRLIEEAYPRILGDEYCKKLFYEIVKQSYIRSQKLYPGSKFIILDYAQFEPSFKNKFKNLGIDIIKLTDLTDENLFQLKYQLSEDDVHPNEKAWELVVPALVKKTGM